MSASKKQRDNGSTLEGVHRRLHIMPLLHRIHPQILAMEIFCSETSRYHNRAARWPVCSRHTLWLKALVWGAVPLIQATPTLREAQPARKLLSYSRPLLLSLKVESMRPLQTNSWSPLDKDWTRIIDKSRSQVAMPLRLTSVLLS